MCMDAARGVSGAGNIDWDGMGTGAHEGGVERAPLTDEPPTAWHGKLGPGLYGNN